MEKKKFVQIPQTKKVVILNLILSLGLVLLAVGFMIIASYAVTGHVSFPKPSIAMFTLGILFLVLVFGISKNGFILFAGILLILWAVLICLKLLGAITLSYLQLWPLLAGCTGISLFIVGLYKYKKIKSNYLFPSIMIVLLCAMFFLFSSKIIKVPFTQFITKCWPVLFIIGGVALVLVFIIQHKNQEDFPYIKDDSDDALEDDVFDAKPAEDILKKIDETKKN